MNGENFRKFAHSVASLAGTPMVFITAVMIVFVWACLGPAFEYSDTWQLVINTGTTVVTFLMVFLIQNTQNRDARAIHLKLDELIRANVHARNSLIDLETLSDADLDRIHEELCDLSKEFETRLSHIREERKSRRKGKK